MTQFNHCRFCDNWRDQGLVKYGRRHYAHFRCYLDAGKSLHDLPAWQLGNFPFFLLKDRGVLDHWGNFADPVLRDRFLRAAKSDKFLRDLGWGQ